MLTAVGADGLQGDEGPELPRHRPADGHRHGVAAGRRRRRSSRPTSRASSRTRSPRCRASSTSTPRCRTARSTIDGRVPPREADAGSGRRRARRGRARALRPAGRRCATRSSPSSTSPAQPILTYTVASSRMDDEALSLVRRQRRDRDAAGGARRRRGRRAWAASTREVRVELDPARLQALNATAADISRQLRQVQQRERRAAAPTSAAPSSRCARIATVQSADRAGAAWRSR